MGLHFTSLHVLLALFMLSNVLCFAQSNAGSDVSGQFPLSDDEEVIIEDVPMETVQMELHNERDEYIVKEKKKEESTKKKRRRETKSGNIPSAGPNPGGNSGMRFPPLPLNINVIQNYMGAYKSGIEELSKMTDRYSTLMIDENEYARAEDLKLEIETRDSRLKEVISQGLKGNESQTYKPLLKSHNEIRKPLKEIRVNIAMQKEYHQSLMRLTQEVLPYASIANYSSAETRNMKIYVGGRLKKSGMAGAKHINDMIGMQKNVRALFVTGLLWTELRLLTLTIAAVFAVSLSVVYVIYSLNYRFGKNDALLLFMTCILPQTTAIYVAVFGNGNQNSIFNVLAFMNLKHKILLIVQMTVLGVIFYKIRVWLQVSIQRQREAKRKETLLSRKLEGK